ncbi:sigma-70 family RNA polymerase sigma factor [Nonomuraea sp. NPDC000554]|uniref:sigma-70 family RNA polymerase sigma factor n=1 Tax=Nonomuraea sp. NPDC000554 TaxID=3154259 RepID=UPI00332828F1
MNEHEYLADRFETHRTHLKAVAYRMLGSLSEAEDAVQEAWFRLSRSDTSDVDNLGGWLTTVVGRVCLDMLRSRQARREHPVGAHMPDPIVSRASGIDPEQQALLADSVGMALLVVVQSLGPAERLAFVLHDMFAVPFEEIAPIVGRSLTATRQLASRARRRVQGAAPVPETDLARQREVVDAFQAAARDGDFDALVAVLDPDVVLRADHGALVEGGMTGKMTEVRGAADVAGQALMFRGAGYSARAALVNGTAGLVNTADGRPMSVMSFTISDGKVVAIDILADVDRLSRLDLAVLGD